MKLTARDIARRALAAVDQNSAYASDALASAFGPNTERRERALATELVYGVLRYRPRIDRALDSHIKKGIAKTDPVTRRALRVAAYQILFLDRVPSHAAVNDAVAAVRRLRGPRVGGFVNGVLRNLDRAGEPTLPALSATDLDSVSLHFCLPRPMVDAVFEQLGDEVVEGCRGLNMRPSLWIRSNRRRITVAELKAELADEGATVMRVHGSALEVELHGSPVDSPSFVAGLWTVQDLGAQIVGRAVAAVDGMRVLDACAGVGGKTTHLLELANVAVDAVDVSAYRLNAMESTAARLGLTGARSVVADLTGDVVDLAPSYDVVLLDAPCSGWGVVRRHPEQMLRVDTTKPDERARMQRSLLDRVSTRVGAGGVLVYSVCTFTREEGPAQIAGWLEKNPEFCLDPAPVFREFGGDGGELSTWPHRHGCDGFYIARLRRIS